MKTANYLMIVLAAAFCFGVVAHGESGDKPGYMGIRMDPRPLPDLLTKHLRLKDRQGVRIQNVGVGLPAERAGLERDDIVIGLNGKDVLDSRDFAEAVQQAGAGAEVSLDVIHLGERKTVKLKLTSFDENADFKAKFPTEPQVVQSWQPGRMFHLQPDAQNWVQIVPELGAVLDNTMTGSSVEFYKFYYSTADGEDYTITIEGDPRQDKTRITVDKAGSIHRELLENIDKLPEEYRDTAKEAVKEARKNARLWEHKNRINMPALPIVPDQMFKHFEKRQEIFPGRLPSRDSRQDALERIEKQMREMQKRIDELETERKNKPRHDEAENTEDAAQDHEHGETNSPSHEEEAI